MFRPLDSMPVLSLPLPFSSYWLNEDAVMSHHIPGGWGKTWRSLIEAWVPGWSHGAVFAIDYDGLVRLLFYKEIRSRSRVVIDPCDLGRVKLTPGPLFHNLNVARAGNLNGHNSPSWGDNGIWVNHKQWTCFQWKVATQFQPTVRNEGLVLPEFWWMDENLYITYIF